jgi:hypothetical protein
VENSGMMEEDDIKAIISNEMSNCSGDEWVDRKRLAMDYYNGHEPKPSGIKGRSEVVSTDVSDAVEWLIPNIIESLSGKSVKFMPYVRSGRRSGRPRNRFHALRIL